MIDLNNLRKEEEFIRLCILDGKWCSPWAHKIDYFGNDWLIDDISILKNSDYPKMYGDDIYIVIHLYYDKKNDEQCFKNGYLYTTSRIIKLNDIILYKRSKIIKKIKNNLKTTTI